MLSFLLLYLHLYNLELVYCILNLVQIYYL